MTNPIKITIAGSAGTGKSAIAELVRQALAISDIEVELIDDNGIGFVDERPGEIARSLNGRIKGIVERGTKVRIQTQNISFMQMKKDEQREALDKLTAMAQADGLYE